MTIRLKLSMGVLAVLLIANSVMTVVAVRYLGGVWMSEVQTRVRLDLNAARAVFQGQIDQMAEYLRACSFDPQWIRGLSSGDRRTLGEMVELVQKHAGIDIVNLIGSDGRVICRPGQASPTDDVLSNPVVSACLRTGGPVKGPMVFSVAALEREGAHLAQRARLKLVATPAAHPTTDLERGEGLVAGAAVPIRDADGQLVAVLLGGNLLNQRYEIVDAIRDEVFPETGTVTIFLGDLRVATNVLLADGSRAVGTRMSAAVSDAVLGRDRVWADRAFVVKDWYITAYEPLRDLDNRIIGSLYVGLPEDPFVQRRNVITGVVAALVVGATVLSLILVFVVTQLVLHPVGRIIEMSNRVIAGDLTARVGIRPPGEMGMLCRAVDAMGEAVAEREARLKETTRQQISRSEQLAAIGRLAAGVAHEINNPLTAVLTFAHLLREKSNMDGQDLQDLDLVIHETTRAAEIVRGLLDFARSRPIQWEQVDLNDLVRQSLRLVGSQKQAKQVKVVEDLEPGLPLINGDRNQLQQVLINLSLNACEAMPDGGVLTLRTRRDGGRIVLEVTDTGHGIKPEHAERIFEPFFTTKPVGKGTGLGLSVSYGIVMQHRGTMEFTSGEGAGTTFRIALPEPDMTDSVGESARQKTDG